MHMEAISFWGRVGVWCHSGVLWSSVQRLQVRCRPRHLLMCWWVAAALPGNLLLLRSTSAMHGCLQSQACPAALPVLPNSLLCTGTLKKNPNNCDRVLRHWRLYKCPPHSFTYRLGKLRGKLRFFLMPTTVLCLPLHIKHLDIHFIISLVDYLIW